MHTIEFDGAEPAPWKVTTDDGEQWHAVTETDAATLLLHWIIQRQQTIQSLPEGAVLL
jgi:hypothetical protein